MTTADADGWTLVLAVHGSEDRLGAQAGPDWDEERRVVRQERRRGAVRAGQGVRCMA